MTANDSVENDYNREFWREIEKEIGGEIPIMIKILLSKCGYEHRFSLQDLTIEDINGIEEHAKNQLKDKLKRWIKNDSNYEHLNPSEFAFLPGHRKIIFVISKNSMAKEMKCASTNSKSMAPSTAREPVTTDNVENDPTMFSSIEISIGQQMRLETDLLNHIRRWMAGKKFHESVSEYMLSSVCV